MTTGLIVPALFFAAIAIVIIGYVLRLVIAPFAGNPLAWLEYARFKKCKGISNRADMLYKEQKIEQALALYHSAFYLDPIFHEMALVERTNSHNLDLLTKVVSIAQNSTEQLASLPAVENLLATRADLLLSFREVQETISKLKKRRPNEKGKGPPNWATAEFQKKRIEIKEKIEGNRKSLRTQLQALFEALLQSSTPSQITYH